MLEKPTQSMHTNFYPNIQNGGGGNFFQHLRPRLQPWTYFLGNFPRALVQCWRYRCNQCTRIFTPTLKRGEGGIFSNIWDQDCSLVQVLIQHYICLYSMCWELEMHFCGQCLAQNKSSAALLKHIQRHPGSRRQSLTKQLIPLSGYPSQRSTCLFVVRFEMRHNVKSTLDMQYFSF